MKAGVACACACSAAASRRLRVCLMCWVLPVCERVCVSACVCVCVLGATDGGDFKCVCVCVCVFCFGGHVFELPQEMCDAPLFVEHRRNLEEVDEGLQRLQSHPLVRTVPQL